jgi:hypothetical protein
MDHNSGNLGCLKDVARLAGGRDAINMPSMIMITALTREGGVLRSGKEVKKFYLRVCF